MKFGLYPRLALAGIRKNKRLYIPYLLTCTGMAMMYYIIIFLQHNEMLDGMRGGTTASSHSGAGWLGGGHLRLHFPLLYPFFSIAPPQKGIRPL